MVFDLCCISEKTPVLAASDQAQREQDQSSGTPQAEEDSGNRTRRFVRNFRRGMSMLNFRSLYAGEECGVIRMIFANQAQDAGHSADRRVKLKGKNQTEKNEPKQRHLPEYMFFPQDQNKEKNGDNGHCGEK